MCSIFDRLPYPAEPSSVFGTLLLYWGHSVKVLSDGTSESSGTASNCRELVGGNFQAKRHVVRSKSMWTFVVSACEHGKEKR